MRRAGHRILVEAKRTLTIGGYPGTGTTTACRTLETRLGLQHVYAGKIFREHAVKHGMTLEEFGAHCEAHPEVDRALDAYQAELLKGDPILLEGRLAGFLAYRDRDSAFKVWFTCDAYVRGKRLVEREGGELEERMAEMRRREESERKRYLTYYGYDINDLSVYDLVLDTSELSREQVVDAVAGEYEKSLKPRKWWKMGKR